MPTDLTGSSTRGSAGLVDILDRVLDKGLVIAGDIKAPRPYDELAAENVSLRAQLESATQARARRSTTAARRRKR